MEISMKINKMGLFIACAFLAVCVCHAVTLPRVHTGTFGSTQSRILNNIAYETETAITGNAVLVDTNATTVVTGYTPAIIGQLLVGSVGTGTNSIWYASGLTTNDWNQLSVLAP